MEDTADTGHTQRVAHTSPLCWGCWVGTESGAMRPPGYALHYPRERSPALCTLRPHKGPEGAGPCPAPPEEIGTWDLSKSHSDHSAIAPSCRPCCLTASPCIHWGCLPFPSNPGSVLSLPVTWATNGPHLTLGPFNSETWTMSWSAFRHCNQAPEGNG